MKAKLSILILAIIVMVGLSAEPAKATMGCIEDSEEQYNGNQSRSRTRECCNYGIHGQYICGEWSAWSAWTIAP